MKKKITLNSDDWIKAGFRALSSGGPAAIKVEAIARELKVSKGSFYWHFKDVAALKTAMLEHWARLATYDAIAKVEHEATGGESQLLALIEVATGAQNREYGGAKAEAAIRNWAIFDKKIAKTVNEIELARLNFVADLFVKAGQPKAQSQQNAHLLYGAMIGLEQLPGNNQDKIRQNLLALLERLL